MHLKVMLEYFHPWPNSAGFFVARDLGWYSQRGLDVELAVCDHSRGDGLHYVARGEAQFAVAPTKRLFVRRERNEPLLGVAAVNNRCLEVIQTVSGKGVRRPRDLSGKRIAMHPTRRGLAIVRHVIAADGGDPNSITVFDAGHRELLPEDIVKGPVDATFGSYWPWEIAMESGVPRDERIVWKIDEIGVPRYHSYLLGAHEHTVREHPAEVRAFLDATARGYHEAVRHPARAAAVYETVVPYFSRSLLRRSLQLVSTTWMHNGEWGVQRADLLKPYAEWLVRYGILTRPAIWLETFSNEYLRQGSRSVDGSSVNPSTGSSIEYASPS